MPISLNFVNIEMMIQLMSSIHDSADGHTLNDDC